MCCHWQPPQWRWAKSGHGGATRTLGRAMLEAVRGRAGKRVLESGDIAQLGKGAA